MLKDRVGMKNRIKGFTIVELLVVIVVIGILAAITIVSYTNISNKAIAAGIQSDLGSDANLLKLYNVEYGYYPSALDENNCPLTPSADTRYCLKTSNSATITYTGSGQTFKLKIKKGSIAYVITEGTSPVAVIVPIVNTNTSASITSTTATLGATIVSDGGDDLTSAGVCWGTSPNPTTNCMANEVGLLSSLTPGMVDVDGAFNPAFAAITPNGKYVFVTKITSGGVIARYSRNTATGQLTALSPGVGSGTRNNGIIVSPDGKHLYTTDTTNGRIYMFSINDTNGALTALSGTYVSTMANSPYNLTLSPDGLYLYVTRQTNSTIYMYSRDPGTGLLTELAPASVSTNTNPYDIIISPDGKNAYVTNVSGTYKRLTVFTRNTSTGQLTYLSQNTLAQYIIGVTISPDGNYVYATAPVNDTVYMFSRNSSDGILTPMATPSLAMPAGSYPTSIQVSPDGVSVYVSLVNSNAIAMISRNVNNGALTIMSTPSVSGTNYPFYGMIISPDGNNIYSCNNTSYNSVSQYHRNKTLSLGAFTQPRTGLPSGTTIYYRGYATNGIGTGYSADSTFVTP